jgi:2-hydroxy-6-oxonona-2,4-dienedioate hydrolase
LNVATPRGQVHVREWSGDGPPIVMMHGFPDDSRVYDRLVPFLAPRRAVAFDFVGQGHSARVDMAALEGRRDDELAAVLDALGLEGATIVAHDASGPVAIDLAIDRQDRVGTLLLLNTYYGNASSLRIPEMIRLLADPNFASLANAILADPNQRLWLLDYTARRFGDDPNDPNGVGVNAVFPQFFGDCGAPDALAAIRSWTAELFGALVAQDKAIAGGKLRSLRVPTRLVFGEDDPDLNPGLARHLAGLFTNAHLHLVAAANHWPQWDQPEIVARLIKEPAAG